MLKPTYNRHYGHKKHIENKSNDFVDLSPDRVLDAVSQLGIDCDGRILALNSYENRVYQLGIDGGAPIIAKFYRPNRWTDEAILEEHGFVQELYEKEIPVVPAIVDLQGRSLHHFDSYRFSIFPRQGGRAPELNLPSERDWLGRFIGRIHAVSGNAEFVHRPTLNVQTFGVQSRDFY